MINNDVLRSLRYMLNIREIDLIALMALAETPVCLDPVTLAQMESYLLRDDEEGREFCPDRVLEDILNGLIVQRRGPRDSSSPAPAASNPYKPLTNNVMLKKMRIAFELHEQDMLDLLSTAEFAVSRPELSALFRSFGHKHYRACGDQMLRYFLKGLTQRLRKDA
ncbi:MAG: hypothetical protein RLY58_1099 [Pseudomonadota bacterium]|jgi:uncharacterized protein YehS (DUF1456 family)